MPLDIQARRHRILATRKAVFVYPNGYGLVQFRSRIRVLEDGFAGPIHYFGLSDSVPLNLKLPAIDLLCAGSVLNMGVAPFMNYGLLGVERLSDRPRLTARELPQEGTDRLRVVVFEFTPPCLAGQEWVYAWEWGFPNLYSVGPAVRDNSGFRCSADIDSLGLSVSFLSTRLQGRVRFEADPTLRVASEDETDGDEEGLPGRQTDHLDFTSYSWSIRHARRGHRYTVGWRLA